MILSAEAPWAVELTDFSKRFRSCWTAPCHDAVKDLTLRLAPGQVLGLFGPNGSGKSTTLKALAGLTDPSSGICRIYGHAAGSDAARELVGYLPESLRIPAYLTGREFLVWCARLSLAGEADAFRRAETMLAWTGLNDAADRRLDTYSKGMRQRLGLAQAIVHDPAVVLLDEPAGGLDPQGRRKLNCLIRDLAGRGKAVVFSSHLLDEATALCDRVAVLGRGRLLAEGTPGELLGVATGAPLPARLEELYLQKLEQHEDGMVTH